MQLLLLLPTLVTIVGFLHCRLMLIITFLLLFILCTVAIVASCNYCHWQFRSLLPVYFSLILLLLFVLQAILIIVIIFDNMLCLLLLALLSRHYYYDIIYRLLTAVVIAIVEL